MVAREEKTHPGGTFKALLSVRGTRGMVFEGVAETKRLFKLGKSARALTGGSKRVLGVSTGVRKSSKPQGLGLSLFVL